MKKILLLTISVVCAACCGCAYMTAKTLRTQTTATNGVVTVTETTKGTTYALFDANASLAKVTVHSGYTTNGTFSPGINASGINNATTTTNLVNVLNALAGLVSKIPL